MKLIIGPECLDCEAGDFVVDGLGRKHAVDRNALGLESGRITEVLVGYAGISSLQFLRNTPNVESVEIRTPTLKDLSVLSSLPRLKSLRMHRPTCRMDVLKSLQSLEDLYLDDWRPGSEGLFHITGLKRLGIQKFGCKDLTGMHDFYRLEELWLNGGKLQSLEGVPPTLKCLRLSSNRHLTSLVPLRDCRQLRSLELDSVKRLSSLIGLEHAPLRSLRLVNSGPILDLRPLENNTSLEVFTFSGDAGRTDPQALYTLPKLKTLIIPERWGIDPERITLTAPEVNLRTTGA